MSENFAKPPPPEDHICDAPDCGAPAPYGFGLPGEKMLWACAAHQGQVGDKWNEARVEKLRQAHAAMQPAQGKLI